MKITEKIDKYMGEAMKRPAGDYADSLSDSLDKMRDSMEEIIASLEVGSDDGAIDRKIFSQADRQVTVIFRALDELEDIIQNIE